VSVVAALVAAGTAILTDAPDAFVPSEAKLADHTTADLPAGTTADLEDQTTITIN
jgi:hypothetical protein